MIWSLTFDALEGRFQVHVESGDARLEAVTGDIGDANFTDGLSRTVFVEERNDINRTSEVSEGLDFLRVDAFSHLHSSIGGAQHENYFVF